MGGRDASGGSLDFAIEWLTRSIGDMTAAARGRMGPDPSPDPGRRARAAAGSVEPGPTERRATGAPPEPAASAGPLPMPVGQPPASAGTAGPRAPAEPAPTPLLDQLGRDLTALASQGLLPPTIGRDAEIARLIEALCRPTRANAVLLGPEGIGKSSIVEGLAQRIVADLVPAPLRGCRIVEIPVTALLAGTQYRGQLEERIAQVIREASRPTIILFFDGVTALASAGRTEGGFGALDSLRPPMERGDLRLIGTADAEAFRRVADESSIGGLFTPIPIAELDRDATRPVLAAIRDRLALARGVRASDAALDTILDFADAHIGNRRFPDKAIDLLSEAIAAAIVEGRATVEKADAEAATAAWTARASSTPTLERLGRDLVALAKAGRLGPIVGREREIDAIVGVLLRRTKRNPALVGPAGSGKTAIVEGLAIRIAAGGVPEALRDVHVFDVPLLTLAAAASDQPKVVEDLIVEARHPSVVVFFDEFHVLASPAVHDIAERLKPPLARGDIAVIGATTAEEYQQFIEPLSALARRFSVVPIEPMDPAAVRAVLESVRASLLRLRGVSIADDALDVLIDLADRLLPNRAQPDKGVDLVEQAVTFALANGRTVVDPATAREAVAALVGMPVDPTAALAALHEGLALRGLLPAAADELVDRLAVSLRGLDAHREQPDAVVLLSGRAASLAQPIAELVASSVFGRAGARIEIDLAGLTEDASISSLLGSAPGLVGSDRTLPLHALRRTPWQVVVFHSVDACATSIRDTIAAALRAGHFTDAMGRTIPLGAAVVILTAPGVDDAATTPIVSAILGADLVACCDVVTGSTASSGAAAATWTRTGLIDPLVARLVRAGYEVQLSPTLEAWIREHLPTDGSDSARWLDRTITQAVVRRLPAAPASVTLGADDAGPSVVSGPTVESGPSGGTGTGAGPA